MILFLDAFALIKLYVAEPGSGPIRQALKGASAVYTVEVSYLAVRSALGEAARLGLLTGKAASKAREDFEKDWLCFNVVAPDQAMLRLAGDFSDSHGLAWGEALCLAAIQKIRDQIGASAMRFIGSQNTNNVVSRLAIAETVI